MTKVKKIPKFKNIKEESRFWDTHNVSDYLYEMNEVKTSFDLSAPKEEILTIRVQSNLKKQLKRIAKSYGINLSTLLRIWFVDKINEKKSLHLSR